MQRDLRDRIAERRRDAAFAARLAEIIGRDAEVIAALDGTGRTA